MELLIDFSFINICTYIIGVILQHQLEEGAMGNSHVDRNSSFHFVRSWVGVPFSFLSGPELHTKFENHWLRN